ncbi:uncharacterized protein [Chironomus tepperi]|uniref:uncharacterized protein n=1 Tax=Chironomus tepperi TaxID=113505 RepID=UPI00391FA175
MTGIEALWVPIDRKVNKSQLVNAAVDHNNDNLYIGRAKFMRDLIPGKVSSDLKSIRICYDGKEYSLDNFEVLVNDVNFIWIEASNGDVPKNAVIGGRAEDGETLYVARAKYLFLTIPGKLHPSHKSAYVPFDSKELAVKTYEVLVRLESNGEALKPKPEKLVSPGFEWVRFIKKSGWPENAVVGGSGYDGVQQMDQYIARAKHDTNVIIGYAYKDGIFYGTFNGIEIRTERYELFVKT